MVPLAQNDKMRKEHARYAVWLEKAAKERYVKNVAGRVELKSLWKVD